MCWNGFKKPARIAACRRCGRTEAEHKPQFTDDVEWIDAGCPEDICHTYLPGWKSRS